MEAVHALLCDQCQILNSNPYALTRADEIAVVRRQEEAQLNRWIELKMQAYQVESNQTAKQESKGIARAGKQRHGL